MSIRSGAPINAMPCNVYVDGQYIREELRRANIDDQFDPKRLVTNLLWHTQIATKSVVVNRVFYYDAIDDQAVQSEKERQQTYLLRINQLDDVHVETGFIRPASRRKPRLQKAVDVKLAVDALEAAVSGRLAAIALVAGDADFAPLADAIRRAGPHVIVLALKASLSSELRDAADRVIYLPAPAPNWILVPTSDDVSALSVVS